MRGVGCWLVHLPLIWEPCGELANGGGGQVDQQLREVELWVRIVAAAGAC
jgi:hypothetical protein